MQSKRAAPDIGGDKPAVVPPTYFRHGGGASSDPMKTIPMPSTSQTSKTHQNESASHSEYVMHLVTTSEHSGHTDKGEGRLAQQNFYFSDWSTKAAQGWQRRSLAQHDFHCSDGSTQAAQGRQSRNKAHQNFHCSDWSTVASQRRTSFQSCPEDSEESLDEQSSKSNAMAFGRGGFQ